MEKLDILNRDVFVSQLLKLIENIASNQLTTCFAINGVWGCGKSFVLDMLQERLEEMQSAETYLDRFLVIRYNCWKFDYYEEPLVAIVSSIMSRIEEKTKLFPDSEERRKLLGVLKSIGISIMFIGSYLVKERVGLDVQKAYETVQKGNRDGASAYEHEHNYDIHFGFNRVLSELSGLLRDLSEKYTVVFLVDELDRCLPRYAIKILERLHHLTEDQSNIITILSIDKKQLLSSVKKIFGFEHPEKYLEKFISFEIKLDVGTVSETICQKYEDYIALFDKDIFPCKQPVEECLKALFTGVNIRTQEQLMKKVSLTHQFLYADKKDYSFMCMEVLLAVMICVYQDDSCFTDRPINVNSFGKVFALEQGHRQPSFAEFFKVRFAAISFSIPEKSPDMPYRYILPEKANLYGAILFTWYHMHPEGQSYVIQIRQDSAYMAIYKNHEELKKFAETIKMIS